MNKPAPKEPSMDEILSSIRQIIADDDAATAPPKGPSAVVTPMSFAPPPEPAAVAEPASDPEPLALSAEQMLDPPEEAPAAVDFSAFLAEDDESDDLSPFEESDEAAMKAEFIDPEDIAFEPEREPVAVVEPAPLPPVARAAPVPVAPPARPRPTAAQAAPMPDPRLSTDIAEELLEPATDAAVRANFSKLSNLGLGNSGLTIEGMMRDMLRPMLKEWLDEHLPAVVERMVEREIGRISRGID